MADIEIGTINGGGVTLGGFAGSNTGSLRASYCATAMTSPNADIHGFAPSAGGVSGCCYLNGGTYRFVDSVHLYQYTDISGAAPVNEPAPARHGHPAGRLWRRLRRQYLPAR